MILLSIDPGLEKTGFAIIDKAKKYSDGYDLILSGLIKTKSNQPRAERLRYIYEYLLKIIKKYKPEVIVMEELFFFKNQKTIISLSQSQGIILLLGAKNNISIETFSPLKIKQIVTGYGLADKKAVKKMIDLTVRLKTKPKDDDEYDAIACGLAYCFNNPKLIK